MMLLTLILCTSLFSTACLPTGAALTWDLEGTPCTTPADCTLLNFNLSEQFSPLVHAPLCVPISDSNNSTNVCTCGVSYCVSASSTYPDGTQYFYCGPCGRIGSSCSGNTTCSHRLSECNGVQCTCKGGEFYDLYYCMIPYYGYEKALQVAIATCIFVALCLLIATVYSTIISPRRAGPHPYLLRLLMRRANEGTRESPPGDTPPKYDDVVDEGGEAPPSYTQALELQQGAGECNLGYDNDSDSVNNNSSSSCDTSNDPIEGDASNTPTSSDNSSNSLESTASREGSWNDVITLTRGSITIASISSSKNSDESTATVVNSHHTGAIPKRRKTSPKTQHQHEKVQQKDEPNIDIPGFSVPPSMTSPLSPPRSTPPELLLHATRL